MTLAVKRPTRLLYATGVAAIFLFLISADSATAEHDHTMCPDYPDYNRVLQNGLNELSKPAPDSRVSPRSSIVEVGLPRSPLERIPVGFLEGKSPDDVWFLFANHKDPVLQQYAYTARRAEDRNDCAEAIRWWQAMADQLKEKSSESKYAYFHSRVVSRLNDVKLVSNDRLFLKENSIGPSDFWDELDSRFHRESFDKLVTPSRNPYTPQWTELTVPVPAYSVQKRLVHLLDQILKNATSDSSDTRKILESAIANYSDSVAERINISADGSTPLSVMDSVKVAELARRLGNHDLESQSMNRAIALLNKSVDAYPSYIEEEGQKDFLNEYPAVCQVITRGVLSYAIRSKRTDLSSIEQSLERNFQKGWIPTAMDLYASRKDRANVLRLYRAAGAELFVPQSVELLRNKSQRLVVGESLIQVGAVAEAKAFSSKWQAWMPSENFSLTRQYWEVAQLHLKQKNINAAASAFRSGLSCIRSAPDKGERMTRIQLMVSSRFLSLLSSEPGPEFQLLRAQALELKKSAERRLIRFECLALANRLCETGNNLQRLGKFEPAGKLFAAAADIKSKNLGPRDIETAKQQVEAGQAYALADKFPEAEKQLKLGADTLRLKGSEWTWLLRSALETYADVLQKLNRKKESEIAYKELRALPY